MIVPFWCRTEWSMRRGAERQRPTVRRKAAASTLFNPFQYIDYNFTLFLNGVFGFAECICVFGAKIENTAIFVLYNNVYIFETWA